MPHGSDAELVAVVVSWPQQAATAATDVEILEQAGRIQRPSGLESLERERIAPRFRPPLRPTCAPNARMTSGPLRFHRFTRPDEPPNRPASERARDRSRRTAASPSPPRPISRVTRPPAPGRQPDSPGSPSRCRG